MAEASRPWTDDWARLEGIGRSLDPAVRLTTKDGLGWRALGVLGACVTAGGLSARRFREEFATALGPLQGFPAGWSIARVEATLVHEARHTRQARWCGLGLHPWLGLPLFALLYVIPILPFGLALPRLLFELDAERAAWRHALAAGAPPEWIRERARHFATVVCSRSYGWPVPRRIGVALFERACERVLSEAASAAPKARSSEAASAV